LSIDLLALGAVVAVALAPDGTTTSQLFSRHLHS
jgi:hypothetical protein